MAKAFLRSIRSEKRKAGITNLASMTRKEVGEVLDDRIKPALVESHEKIVESWRSDVGFAAKKFIRSDSITIYVYPTGSDKKIWHYVDRGTRLHHMPAVFGKLMVFRAGGTYVPKTMARPARTVVGGGKVVGGVTTFAQSRKAYTHPGSEGRGFTMAIARDILPEFRREVENAFRRIARRVNQQ